LAPLRYHKIGHNQSAIEALFVTLFLEAHERPPKRMVIDLDVTDDPLHGHQEGGFFHGYYDCYCYLPLYIFCGRHLLAAKLRRSNIDASAGAREEIARIVAQVRARWPKTEVWLRADSGFAREELMAWCEENGIHYVFGLARNNRLVAKIGRELKAAQREAGKTGRAARRFKDFRWTTLDSWSRKRRVIAKAEWTRGEANPRFIVTSLDGSQIAGQALYEDIYCTRSDMENRIKECQTDLFADRTPTATGAVIATVPLGPKAIIDLEDWERIVSEYTDKWNYIIGPTGKKYATLGAGNSKTQMVARIVTGAKQGQRVRYIDGDTCDLRKENLRVIDNKR
jgi:Transposase DDE domain group 1